MKMVIWKCAFVGLTLLCSFEVSGDDAVSSFGKEVIPIKNDDMSKPGRPKAPSMQFIECWYGDGVLSFDFNVPEGMCNMSVFDKKSGFVYNYVFDSSEHAEVNVGNLEYADISISTASGHRYVGEIVIN